ncbi:hypothetical protein LINPERPRIM_LOCUS7780 [Linum perenne]
MLTLGQKTRQGTLL